MPTEPGRHRKKPTQYSIVIVPEGKGGSIRRFRAGPVKLWLIGVLGFCTVVAFTLAVLMYTPVALYIPIPNPELERKYGHEIAETQRQLNYLAEDILLLKDYNQQLRKALGERNVTDSIVSPGPAPAAGETQRLSSVAGVSETNVPTDGAIRHEDGGDLDLSSLPYDAVIANYDGFRAAFPLVVPTQGFITQGFDPSRKHFGIDYATKRGTAVHASADGYVVFAGWTYDDGNMMIISHGGGYLTVYKHNHVLVKGAHGFVKRGELIALAGSSGNTSLGPHLHFEVWKDGIPQDPNQFLLNPTSIQ